MDEDKVDTLVREFEKIQGYKGLDHRRMARAAMAVMEHLPPPDEELVKRLRKMAKCVYLATEARVADDLSVGLTKAADLITALLSDVEMLKDRLRLIKSDATNEYSAPGARLQRIADYATIKGEISD